MKKLLTLLTLGFACALSAAEVTNITILITSTKDNGQIATRTNRLSLGELITVKSLVATNNALALVDTNVLSITEQRFVSNLLDERIKRMRLVWLRERRSRLQEAIGKIEFDPDLDKVEAEVNKYAP